MSAPHASISVDPTKLDASARSLEAAKLDTTRAQGRLTGLGAVPEGVPGGARTAANAAVDQAISVLPRQAATIDSLVQQLRTTSTRARQIFEQSKVIRQPISTGLSIHDWAKDQRKYRDSREAHRQRLKDDGLRGKDLHRATARALRDEHGFDSLNRSEQTALRREVRAGGAAPSGVRDRLAERRAVRGPVTLKERAGAAGKTFGGGDPKKSSGKLGLATTAASAATTLKDDSLSGAQKRRAIANTVITNGITKGLTKVVPGPGWVVGGGIMAIDAVTGGGATKTISKGVDVGIRGAEAVGKGAVSLVKKIPTPW